MKSRAQIIKIHETVIKAWVPWGQQDRAFLALALAGEVGEIANLVKKEARGDGPLDAKHIREELADARIYLELLAEACGVHDLDVACDEVVDGKLRARWPEAF